MCYTHKEIVRCELLNNKKKALKDLDSLLLRFADFKVKGFQSECVFQ